MKMKIKTECEHGDILKSARYWEYVARRTVVKNVQLYNANRMLMIENELYISRAFKTGGTILKKK
jgi:hypothetical protein